MQRPPTELAAAGCEKVFQDEISGATTKRPGLDLALAGVGIFYSCNNFSLSTDALETATISGDLFNRTALNLAKAAAYQKRLSIILFAIDRTIYRVWLDRIEDHYGIIRIILIDGASCERILQC